MQIYEAMFQHFGPRGWWPGESRLEVIIGAILTQAVSWSNVVKAIDNMKSAGLIDIKAILAIDEETLAGYIKPALYNRQKAKKLKAIMKHIAGKYEADLDLMFRQPLKSLRTELLAIWGIGPETADSILLYAGDKSIFVIDTYTKRIFSRLGIVDEAITYQDMQDFMHFHLPKDTYLYNEFHALLVGTGARYCRKKQPNCWECPLQPYCVYFTQECR